MTVELAREEHGAGEPPFVFVHGWCCDRSFFAPQVEHFMARHRVVTPDLRGCGASPVPDDGYDIPTLAADVGGLCDELGLERPVVVGHSLGGMIALELAAARPELVGAVVAVDPGPIEPLPGTRERFAALADRLEGSEGEAARREYVETSVFAPGDDPVRRNQIATVMCAAPLGPAARILRGIVEWDGVGALRRAPAPLLVILAEPGGSNDPCRLAAHRPDMEVAITEGTGHFNQLFAPEQVTPLIEGFVRANAGMSEA